MTDKFNKIQSIAQSIAKMSLPFHEGCDIIIVVKDPKTDYLVATAANIPLEKQNKIFRKLIDQDPEETENTKFNNKERHN